MTVETPPPAGTSGRRTELRRRRRRRRILALTVVLALLAAVALGFTAYLVRSGPEPPPPVEQTQRTQRTLLVQVLGPGGDAVSTTLFGVDPPARTGAAVLVPAQVLVNVPGSASLPIGRALRTVAPESVREIGRASCRERV